MQLIQQLIDMMVTTYHVQVYVVDTKPETPIIFFSLQTTLVLPTVNYSA